MRYYVAIRDHITPLFLLAWLAVVQSETEGLIKCPIGWFAAKHGVCYTAVHPLDARRQDYYQSEAACSRLHPAASLPNPATKDLWSELQSFIRTLNHGAMSEVWLKSNGGINETLEWSGSWNEFQAAVNRVASEGKCIATSAAGAAKWKFSDCASGKHNTICQQEAASFKKKPLRKRAVWRCPEGWYVGHKGSCYILNRSLKNYKSANTICNNLHPKSHLPYFTSRDDWKEFHNFIMDINKGIWLRTWLMGTDEKTEGKWLSDDSKPLSWTHWYTSEPNGAKAANCIVTAYPDGSWSDEPCVGVSAVSCQLQSKDYDENFEGLRGWYCPEGWLVGLNGTCYRSPNQVNVHLRTHNDGIMDCKAQHPVAHLPDFSSKAEWEDYAVAVKAFNGGPWANTWIQGMWQDDKLEDLPLRQMVFAPWSPGEPKKTIPFKFGCITSSQEAGGWILLDCSGLNNVICQLRQDEVPKDWTEGYSCPTGWFVGDGNCLKAPFGLQPTRLVNKKKATDTCAKVPGEARVVSLKDIQQFRHLRQFALLVNKNVWTNLWYNGNDDGKEGHFVKDGSESTIKYNLWQPTEPNGAGVANCLSLNANGLLADDICILQHGAVCELKSKEKAVRLTSEELLEKYFSKSVVCPSGWYAAKGGVCYKALYPLDTMLKDYYAASEGCKRLNPRSNVPRFETKSDWDSFADYVFSINNYRWSRIWLRSSKVSTKNKTEDIGWTDNYGSRKSSLPVSCPVTWYPDGKWKDTTCDKELHNTICQLYVDPDARAATTETTICPEGWYAGTEGNCYLLFRTPSTQMKAIEMCTKNNPLAHLPVFHTHSEWIGYRTFIKEMNKNVWLKTWIDGSDNIHEGVWIANSSGQEIGWSNWHNVEPNGQRTQNCLTAAYDQGQWGDESCAGVNPFACQLSQQEILSNINETDIKLGQCPVGWIVGMQGICYRAPFSLDTRPRLYQAAGKECYKQHDGAHLPYFKGEKEWMNYVKVIKTINMNVWTNMWLNGRARARKDEFRLDNSNVITPFFKWAPAQPTSSAVDSCIVPTQERGFWVNLPCDTSVLNVVCQLRLEQPDNIHIKEKNRCPFDWFNYGGACYKSPFSLTSPKIFSKFEADKICQDEQEGSHSPYFNNEEQWNGFKDYINLINRGAWQLIWMNGNDEDFEGSFTNDESGKKLGFSNWGPGEPNGYDGIDCIATLHANGGWSDENCANKYWVVCQIFEKEYIKTLQEPDISEEDKDDELLPSVEEKTIEIEEELTVSGCRNNAGKRFKPGEEFMLDNLRVICIQDEETGTSYYAVLSCCENGEKHCVEVNSVVISKEKKGFAFVCTAEGSRYEEIVTTTEKPKPRRATDVTTPSPTPRSISEISGRSVPPAHTECYDDRDKKRDIGDTFVYGNYIVECMANQPKEQIPVKIAKCCETGTNLCAELWTAMKSAEYDGYFMQCRDSGSHYVKRVCTGNDGSTVENGGTLSLDSVTARCIFGGKSGDNAKFEVARCCEEDTINCVNVGESVPSKKYVGYKVTCTERGSLYDKI